MEAFRYLVTCPICMENFVSPRMLPCQHTFCETCLTSYIEGKRKQMSQKTKHKDLLHCKCPICRFQVKLSSKGTIGSDFPRSYMIQIVLENLESNQIDLKEESASKFELQLPMNVNRNVETNRLVRNKNDKSNSVSVASQTPINIELFPFVNSIQTQTELPPLKDFLDCIPEEETGLAVSNPDLGRSGLFILNWIINPMVIIVQKRFRLTLKRVAQMLIAIVMLCLFVVVYLHVWNVLVTYEIYTFKLILLLVMLVFVYQLVTFERKSWTKWKYLFNHICLTLVHHMVCVGLLIAVVSIFYFLIIFISNIKVITYILCDEHTCKVVGEQWTRVTIEYQSFERTSAQIRAFMEMYMQEISNSGLEKKLREIFSSNKDTCDVR